VLLGPPCVFVVVSFLVVFAACSSGATITDTTVVEIECESPATDDGWRCQRADVPECPSSGRHAEACYRPLRLSSPDGDIEILTGGYLLRVLGESH